LGPSKEIAGIARDRATSPSSEFPAVCAKWFSDLGDHVAMTAITAISS
jgi:hypothetical protein